MADGAMDVYGLDRAGAGFMINHASGETVWDAIVAVAMAADFVIMPVGCPVCVTRAELIDHLPIELRDPPAGIVTSGAELRDVIRAD
jgi:hypothetical protein